MYIYVYYVYVTEICLHAHPQYQICFKIKTVHLEQYGVIW